MNTKTFHSYIGGETVIGGERVPVENPATKQSCGSFTAYTPEMLDRALEQARDAFAVWSRTPMQERVAWMTRLAEALEQRRDEVIELLIAETGKPQDNAEYDYGMLVECLGFFGEEVQRLGGETIPDRTGEYLHKLVRHPVGVVVGFLAWNFPLLNLGYKLGPILASGCSCVIKPSHTTPLATALVGEIMGSIDFPAGVVNIVLGEDREVASRLLTSPIPAMVTMIGSTEVGCEVIRASATTIKRYSLELGGNAPVIVYPDFDAELAAERIVGLKLVNSGQVCVSPNRCFVHERSLDAFVTRAREVMAGYHFGSGPGPEPRMGPLMTASHLEGLLAKVEQAQEQGAEVLCGEGACRRRHARRGTTCSRRWCCAIARRTCAARRFSDRSCRSSHSTTATTSSSGPTTASTGWRLTCSRTTWSWRTPARSGWSMARFA